MLIGRQAHEPTTETDMMRNRKNSRKTAFTLIELLVVVAIIAMLVAILLPSLKCARAKGKSAVCGTTLRAMGRGLATYFTEENGWIPGINTSGVGIRFLDFTGAGGEAYRRADVPAQSFDWMTPWLRYETDLGMTRADKFRVLLDTYSCPSQRSVSTVLYPERPGDVPDAVDFGDWDSESWTSLSYLMPSGFQYWGQKYSRKVIATHPTSPRLTMKAQVAADFWSAVSKDYKSNINKVGDRPDRKIAAADGARFMTGDLVVDFDCSPAPRFFGSFTSGGAWRAGSTAYGVSSESTTWDGRPAPSSSESNGYNLELSYRHGCGRGAAMSGSVQANVGSINAVFFDGHVQTLEDRDSREIEYWYPSGTWVQNPNDGLLPIEETGAYRENGEWYVK